MNERPGGYQLFMLGLSLYVLGALVFQTLARLDPETVVILDAADTAICLIFFLDFVRSLALAEDRRRYLVTWGWLDLLSSIPTVDWFRWGRAARVFRILRVLRAMRATRILTTFVLERRAENAFWAALLLAILVTIFGSVAILNLEAGADANIDDSVEALWWAFVTITTVGYGDYYPVTPAGRALAAALMVTGIGLFGTFTAFVASAFFSESDTKHEAELRALRAELAELRGLLEVTREGGERPGEAPKRPASPPRQPSDGPSR